jgi:hypothetical protein
MPGPTITTEPPGGGSDLTSLPSSSPVIYDPSTGDLGLAATLTDDLVVPWSTGTGTTRWNFLVPDAGRRAPFTPGYSRTVGLTIGRSIGAEVDWKVLSAKSDELPPPTFLHMDGITLGQGDKDALAAMYERCIRTLPAEIRAGLGYDQPVEVEMDFDYWGTDGGGNQVHRRPHYSGSYTINGFADTIANGFPAA